MAVKVSIIQCTQGAEQLSLRPRHPLRGCRPTEVSEMMATFADNVNKMKEPFKQRVGESDEDYEKRMKAFSHQLAEYLIASQAILKKSLR